MKKSIKYSKFAVFALSTGLFFSCAQGEKNKNLENESQVSNFSTIEENEKLIFEEKKNHINFFYDDIGFEIIDLILKDRVYEQKPEKRTDLKGIVLDSFPEKLNDPTNELNIKRYAEKLIEFKNYTLNSIENETLQRDFLKAKDSLLESSFFKDTIIDGRGENQLYIGLISDINVLFQQTGDTILNTEQAYADPQEYQKKRKTNEIQPKEDLGSDVMGSLSGFIMQNGWWLFSLLIGSLLLNLSQFFYLKKQYRSKINKTNRLKRNHDNDSQYFQAKPTAIQISEVKNTTEQEYEKLQQSLSNKYHRDCVASVSLKFDSLKSDAISEATSKSFNRVAEFHQFLNTKLEKDRSILSNELENYVTKSDAKQQLNTSIAAQNFAQKVNTNIVSEDEIDNKVNQLKQVVISELPNVIFKPQLTATLEKLKKDIAMALQKMIQDNLVYYFAFADVDGALNDIKKTKIIERDSAIKISINPDDVTKASFILLLDKDDMMQAGIMSYDSLLVPICDLLNENFNRNGTRIEQIGQEYGTMELEDGIWKVKKKLPIKVI